jgi:nitrile hydratase subunit beta
MQGPHDVGGRRGYGRIDHRRVEAVFHHRWEGRAFAAGFLAPVLAESNIDAFRHAMERLGVLDHLSSSYYGRWTHAAVALLAESGAIDPADLDERIEAAGARPLARPAPNPPHHRRPEPPTGPGFTRSVDRDRRFAPGDPVEVRPDDPPGHTRVPGYLRGRTGVVVATRPACVWPDRSAHGAGEDPQWLYAVRFEGHQLWGSDAEPATSVTVDLFEPHLEPCREGS